MRGGHGRVGAECLEISAARAASGGARWAAASQPRADPGLGRNRVDTSAGWAKREASRAGARRSLQRLVAGREDS